MRHSLFRTMLLTTMLIAPSVGSRVNAQVQDIYVEVFDTVNGWIAVSGFPNRLLNQPGLPSGSNVSFSAQNTRSYRVFGVSSSSDDIGTVSVNGPSTGFATLFIGRWNDNTTIVIPTQPLSVSGARNVQRVSASGKVKLQLRIDNDLADTGAAPANEVSAWQIARLDFGSLKGPVTHNPSQDAAAGNLTWIQGTFIDSAGDITARAGNITTVIATNGIRGDIKALQGSIGTINVTSASGSIGQSASVRATIQATAAIDSITARDVFADIDTDTDANPALSAISSLIVLRDFFGSLRAGTVANSFDVTQDLGATVHLMDTGLPIGRNLFIGRSFLTGATVNLPANKLQGRIVINSRNQPGGVWQGLVTVGGVALSPAPAYDNTATSIGGGTAGLAPFLLHAVDSFPTRAQNITPLTAAPSTTSPIRIRHYGPVILSGNPFVVGRRRMGTSNEYQDQSACFTPTWSASEPTIVTLTPRNAIGGDVTLQGGFEYRISLNQSGSNTLKCDLVSGNPAVAAYSPDYTSTICEECLGDADNSGVVNFNDTLNVLANFGSTECLKFGDADRDGDVDFADNLTVLANFNRICCGSGLMAGGGGGEENPAVLLSEALAQLGFESLEDFIKHIRSLDEAERNERIQELGKLLGG